ncbi:2,3-diaminopropionate biosynthesis protein SbnA [Faecalibacter sp. LW9]|uniref:2,3-diaminopropionate biosynthesis protein SbnA n=1 Tax=Faecalibacter sp. LW9 TaxID=3103144 RepID=UPI002B0004C8|nr:2,3-diaminopropionate biosynthesis protein SbnA [Faecalibacter sp. LW9]
MNNQENVGILSCIGNTPLIELACLFHSSTIRLYGKMEMFNPGGSIKDRTAYHILKNALKQGILKENSTVIESTSGNMGIGLARICHFLGLKLILVTDPHINTMCVTILKAFKAQIITVDQHDGKGGYLNTRLEKVQQLLTEIPDSFWPNQYHNMDNPLAHEQTFVEIVQSLGKNPDYIFVSTSTCGTLRGLADAIEKYKAPTKIIAVDAKGSVIFGDEPQKRIIPGMGASRKSTFVQMNQVHQVVHISDQETVEGCHQLLNAESILAGGSSGALVKALEKTISSLPEEALVVAIFPDNGERYLQTIYSEDWVQQHFKMIKQ